MARGSGALSQERAGRGRYAAGGARARRGWGKGEAWLAGRTRKVAAQSLARSGKWSERIGVPGRRASGGVSRLRRPLCPTAGSGGRRRPFPGAQRRRLLVANGGFVRRNLSPGRQRRI